MKRRVAFLVWLTVVCVLSAQAQHEGQEAAGGLGVAFVDSAWGGDSVPEGQQCQKFEGTGKSPEIEVTGIPSGANAIVLEFSDRSYQPMDNGDEGAGLVGVLGASATRIVSKIDVAVPVVVETVLASWNGVDLGNRVRGKDDEQHCRDNRTDA